MVVVVVVGGGFLNGEEVIMGLWPWSCVSGQKKLLFDIVKLYPGRVPVRMQILDISNPSIVHYLVIILMLNLPYPQTPNFLSLSLYAFLFKRLEKGAVFQAKKMEKHTILLNIIAGSF